MRYYTEKVENMFDVKCDNGDMIINIGMVEKPYHNSNLYVATGLNNVTLKDGDSVIFTDFQKAVKAITEAHERSITE